jgi:hypothetical protein
MGKAFFVSLLALCLALGVAGKDKNSNTKAKSDMSATVALSGVVCDEVSGESLAGVEVKLDGTEIKTYTDFDGRFTLNDVTPGKYHLVTNYISYEKKEVTLSETAPKDSPINIKLKPSL